MWGKYRSSKQSGWYRTECVFSLWSYSHGVGQKRYIRRRGHPYRARMEHRRKPHKKQWEWLCHREWHRNTTSVFWALCWSTHQETTLNHYPTAHREYGKRLKEDGNVTVQVEGSLSKAHKPYTAPVTADCSSITLIYASAALCKATDNQWTRCHFPYHSQSIYVCVVIQALCA